MFTNQWSVGTSELRSNKVLYYLLKLVSLVEVPVKCQCRQFTDLTVLSIESLLHIPCVLINASLVAHAEMTKHNRDQVVPVSV